MSLSEAVRARGKSSAGALPVGIRYEESSNSLATTIYRLLFPNLWIKDGGLAFASTLGAGFSWP